MAKKKAKKKRQIPPSNWKWYGNAAHFIGGRWCRFHMATEIGGYVVSTVGEYVPPSASGGREDTEDSWLMENWPGEDIGYNRKYETMVFKVKSHCRDKNCGCGLPIIVPTELDANSYNKPGPARKGHMEMCEKWSVQ